MKQTIITLLLVLLYMQAANADTHELKSPDEAITITVEVDNEVTWSIYQDGNHIMGPSSISLTLEKEGVLGKDAGIKDISRESDNYIIETPIYRKSEVVNNYNQMIIELDDGLGIIFRAYDDGAAYRLTTSFSEEITILDEEADFVFPAHEKAYVPYIVPKFEERYTTSFESTYDVLKFDEIEEDSLIILPMLVDIGDNRKVVITEVDLEDYAGLFLKVNATRTGLTAEFAPYPLEEEIGGHNDLQSLVVSRKDYIAKTEGRRSFPWRAFAISNEDIELLDNDIVARLASPNRIGDLGWIKPGKVAWDWWNFLNVYDVDFRAGVNTETYKYYIDFAAENGIEYVILDEGWSERESLLDIKPYIDLESIIDHAKQKGVDIILWAGWLPLDKEMEEVISTYSEMGVAGYKIDFMDRDDQKTVNFYYRVAEIAAEYKQLVNFHGSYKPTGLQFTYPNAITFEGVYGLENVKWTDFDDFPGYDVTIPYIRMLAGAMDYTPGAMINANIHNWRAIYARPMSQGTRCHQLAMYVIYESPLSMMADSPANYKREQECTDFIASVPTIFDETVPIAGEVGEYVLMARRKDQNWHVGAMTNWDERVINLDFSFLDDGKFKAIIYKDGINADRHGNDYKRKVLEVTNESEIEISMAPGGGWAASIKPIE